MRLIIEARMIGEGATSAVEAVTLAEIERDDHDLTEFGLSLAEGRALLAAAQSALVKHQAFSWLQAETSCPRCHAPLRHKDSACIVMRTVFGKVSVGSPRLWACTCDGAPAHSVSPLNRALRRRVTPELEYLQVKWAAHLSFAAATRLLKEILPLQHGISTAGTKNRVRAAGKALDARVEQEIVVNKERLKVEVADKPRESTQVTAVSVDSAWLRHCEQPELCYRHVNMVAGRATLAGGLSKVYAYVGKQIPSGAARLDHFLLKHGVKPEERVTVISDGAGEFTNAVKGSQLARGRIMDWFHLSMKFRAAERSVVGCRFQEGPDWSWVDHEIGSAKWLTWHGKGRKAMARLQGVTAALERWPQHEHSTLWWNVRTASGYLRLNEDYLVNYGARYRKGLPISSSIAESAVNEVVSQRMAKKQQMHWSDEGAHCLAQVRVADINGELSPGLLVALPRPKLPRAKRSTPRPRWNADLWEHSLSWF